ncbi:MAG TPA: hypothetical protein VMC05_13235 [Xanthobacteraceae bacterium]|nr:hypothetical protein [Xanthobacteraceae bacterium]
MDTDTGNVVPISRHFCPACGRPMRVVLVIPRFGSFPELHTYECKDCGVSLTEAAKETPNGANGAPAGGGAPRG